MFPIDTLNKIQQIVNSLFNTYKEKNMSIIDELDEIEEFLNGFFGVDLDVKNSYRPKCKPPFPTTKEEIVISIPAVNKENINVSLKDDILTVDIGYPKDDLLNRNMSTEKRQYIVKNRDKPCFNHIR